MSGLLSHCKTAEVHSTPAVSLTAAVQRPLLLRWTRLPHGPPGRCQLARCEGPLLGLRPVQAPLPCTWTQDLVKDYHGE